MHPGSCQGGKKKNKKINVALNIQQLRWEVPRGTSGVMKLFQLVLRWSEQLRLLLNKLLILFK